MTPNIHSMTTQELEAHAAKVLSVMPDPRRFEIENALWLEYKYAISKARGKKRQALKDEFNAKVNARLAEIDDNNELAAAVEQACRSFQKSRILDIELAKANRYVAIVKARQVVAHLPEETYPVNEDDFMAISFNGAVDYNDKPEIDQVGPDGEFPF